MPFKSKAQQGFINAAAKRGEVPQKVADEFNKKSKGKMKDKPMHVDDAPLGYKGKLRGC